MKFRKTAASPDPIDIADAPSVTAAPLSKNGSSSNVASTSSESLGKSPLRSAGSPQVRRFVNGVQTAAVKSATGVRDITTRTGSRGVSVLRDFRTFISRGNVIDLAVALVMGTAFTAIVTSLVKDILTPPIGLAMGQANLENSLAVLRAGKSGNWTYVSVQAAAADGAVTINYGNFLQAILYFLIVSTVMFFLMRLAESMRRQKPSTSTEHDCPYCFSKVDLRASRCPRCTSTVDPATPNMEDVSKA